MPASPLRTAAVACVGGAAIAAVALVGSRGLGAPDESIDAPAIVPAGGPQVLVALGGAIAPGRQAMVEQLAQSLPSLGARFRLVSERHSETGLESRGHGGVWIVDDDASVRVTFAPENPGEWIPAGVVIARLRRLGAGLPAGG